MDMLQNRDPECTGTDVPMCRKMTSLDEQGDLEGTKGKKRGCITFGRRVRSLQKCLRELLGHVGKKIREAS